MKKGIVKEELERETLKKKYEEICPKYERLGRNLKQDLVTFLNDEGVDVLDIIYRIKEFDSLYDKMQRKDHKDSFQEIEDICGLRIICFYPSDLDRISRIINSEFDVLESIDKADLLEPDRFGYRSMHFILTVKKDWLKAPSYRGMNGLKAEVQVRTILMHAWADIEYKLAYKKKEHIPDQFKRKLSQLSALLEVTDEQFDFLRKEKEKYREQLISEEVKKSGRFDVNQQMNMDSLQAFLDFYFPDRMKSMEDTIQLLDEIIKFGVSIRVLVKGYERVKDNLPTIEMELFKLQKPEKKFNQIGIVRIIMDLTNDAYWQTRKEMMPKYHRDLNTKWRAKLSNRDR